MNEGSTSKNTQNAKENAHFPHSKKKKHNQKGKGKKNENKETTPIRTDTRRMQDPKRIH